MMCRQRPPVAHLMAPRRASAALARVVFASPFGRLTVHATTRGHRLARAARGGLGQRGQPSADYRAVSPHRGERRLSRRQRARARDQAQVARARGASPIVRAHS
jgi:hypothetical protein